MTHRRAYGTTAGGRGAVVFLAMLGASVLLVIVGTTPPAGEVRRAVGFLLTPVQSALAGVTRTGASIVEALTEIDQLRERNRSLQERNETLEVRMTQLEEIRRQNEQLTELLRVGSALQYESVAATVIGRGVAPNERVISVDQGTDRGIAVGDVVVGSGAALAGRVIEVGPNFSRVLLISDPRSVVAGLVQSSRATGEVHGQLSGSLVLSRIPALARVTVGDTVVTAGIDLGAGVRSAFPGGLVVGRVVDVRKEPNDIVQSAFVEPAASLDSLESVLVITGYAGGVSVPAASSEPSPVP